MHFTINNKLSIEDVKQIMLNNATISLSHEATSRINNCRDYLNKKLNNNNQPFYGINTGFGSLYNKKISNDDLSQLQKNLLISHACGTGKEVPQEIVKIMLLLKVQSLAYGNSGVQLKTVEQLIFLFNNNILPVVYQQGSLGASGDLAPLAHLCLPLVGMGNVWIKENNNWQIQQAAAVYRQHNYETVNLQSKEGLALINGTQFMSAYAVWCLIQAFDLYEKATLISAISLDGFDGRIEPFNVLLHKIRPHAGQIKTAIKINDYLRSSEIVQQQKTHVQDPYAFRCIPQVHGATYDTLVHVKNVVETEINSVTDNPNIFIDEDLIISGGNFHGQPLALVLDFMAIAVAELGSISERRTYQLISGLRGLPPFLIKNAGLNSGFMIPQYTAASIVSQNKQLCTPASVDSIVSSNGQEDHVSMGANAATKCYTVLQNVQTVLAIELLNAAQAIELRRPLKSSAFIENILTNYRTLVAHLTEDRLLHNDIKNSEQFVNTLKI